MVCTAHLPTKNYAATPQVVPYHLSAPIFQSEPSRLRSSPTPSSPPVEAQPITVQCVSRPPNVDMVRELQERKDDQAPQGRHMEHSYPEMKVPSLKNLPTSHSRDKPLPPVLLPVSSATK